MIQGCWKSYTFEEKRNLLDAFVEVIVRQLLLQNTIENEKETSSITDKHK